MSFWRDGGGLTGWVVLLLLVVLRLAGVDLFCADLLLLWALLGCLASVPAAV